MSVTKALAILFQTVLFAGCNYVPTIAGPPDSETPARPQTSRPEDRSSLGMYRIGDRVVVRCDRLQLRSHQEDSETLTIGTCLTVRDTRDDLLGVSAGTPPWVHEEEVIPLGSAIDHFTTRIDRHPHDPRLHFARGKVCIELKEYRKAIADLDHAIELDPNFAGAYSERAVALSAVGDYERAVADFSRAVELEPSNLLMHLRRGALYLELRDPDRAAADAEAVLRLDSSRAEGWILRGRAHLLRGSKWEAVSDFHKAIEVNGEVKPLVERLLIEHLAPAEEAGGEGDDVQDDPRVGLWVEHLASAEEAEAEGDADATNRRLLAALDIAEQLASDQIIEPLVETHYLLGRHYHQFGQSQAAEEHYLRTLQLTEQLTSPELSCLAEVLMRLGWIQVDLGKPEEAISALLAAVSYFEGPDGDLEMLIASLAPLAAVQLQQGAYVDAFHVLTKLADCHQQLPDPDTAALAHVLCATCEVGLLLGQTDKAATAMRKAAALAEHGQLGAEMQNHVYQCGLKYAKLASDAEAMAYFEARMAPTHNKAAPMPEAFPHDADEMSEAKRIAKAEMEAARRYCEQARRRWETAVAVYEAQYDSIKVGNLAAGGVHEMYSMPEPPNLELRKELLQAEREYEEARLRFEHTH